MNTQEKIDLQKMKVNATKITKICADGNKLCTGKNGGHMPSSLGGRSIVVVSESDKILAVFENFKIRLLRC